VPNQKKLSGINLVPQDEFDSSVVGKALKWALTTGKSIVILTEFVVILAFLSRFQLDRDYNDINEIIVQKQGLVQAYSRVEQEILDVQARMTLAGEIQNTSVNVTTSLDELSLMVPLDTRLETVELNQSGWILRGVAGSETGFANLISRLENSNKFDAINIGDVRFDLRKGGLVFSIEAIFPQAPTERQITNRSLEEEGI
jgi:Tfp pilus assembly protein PilN